MEIKPISKYTITHPGCLITGDRFYFINDPKKVVYELRYHTMIKWYGKETRLSICINDLGKKVRVNPNRVAVFMRSKNPRRQPGFIKSNFDTLDRFFIHNHKNQ